MDAAVVVRRAAGEGRTGAFRQRRMVGGLVVKIAISWPNRPCHWSALDRGRKAQKHEAWALTLAQPTFKPGVGRIPVTLTFRKNDRHRFDLDNALAACKGALDGLAIALGVDDSRFDVRPVLGEPVPGGAVEITVEQALAACGVA
jgi:crossover junction endodeoxyribonuclease RusA